MIAPSVSFLCTAYRTEATVVATIESVLAQTRTDWQMIVVDNGNSEEMARIVRPFTADPRIELVRQENQFAAGGVNAAGRVATGRYVSPLHTDDLVTPHFLERLVPLIDADPHLHALCCDARYLTAHGLGRETSRDPVPARYRRGEPVALLELVEGWLPYYTALVRKEVWDAVGGMRHDARTVEDLAFWIDVVAAGYRVTVLEEPLAVYRMDEGSDSQRAAGVEIMEASREAVITDAVERFGGPAERTACREKVAWSRHRRAVVRARRLLVDRDWAGAREAAREARELQDDRRTRVMAAGLARAPRTTRNAYLASKSLFRLRRRLSARAPLETAEDRGSR